jgi:hypothetical protein
MRLLAALVLSAAAAAPLAAQAPAQPAANTGRAGHADPDQNATGGLKVPGWTARFDRPAAAASQVSFTRMGKGYHVTAGPAAIYYDSTRTASGAYTAAATFTQTKPSAHPEAYGIFVGGSNLAGADQRYLYFIVRQDGKYAVKHRAGAETHTVVDWTASPAVRRVPANGKATNALAVRATAADVRFLVNGTEVAKLDRANLSDVDGVAGLRVNHNLDVHVDRFAVTK